MRTFRYNGDMTLRVLETKLHVPRWRAGNVARARLVAALEAGVAAGSKLTLISAPPGYGKTTLAVEWVQRTVDGRRTLWLALDDADNQPLRFFSHWFAALARTDVSLSENLPPLAAMTHLPPVQTLVEDVLNALTQLAFPLLIILDDYHVITELQLHAAIAYFIDHQPMQVHLALTTRVDPPLPLARLRARGQLTEVRAHHLRFTPEEAQRFFVESMHLDLDAATIRTLETRTEGWAAGLQLAALALRNLPDPQQFVAGFGGSHRYVLDYLAEEVLRQLDDATRRFLIQTSVLTRFNAAACDALTGRADSQDVLHALEQANLFVTPLDDARIWYRYHHLFADYLRTLLSKAETAALCKQAVAWCEANDLTAEAVHYAFASADTEFAAEVVARALRRNATWSGGNVAQWVAWLDALPAQVFSAQPQFSLDAARVLYLAGRFEQAEVCIAQAEATLQTQPLTPATDAMLALATLHRGAIAAARGEAAQAITQITAAQARLPQDEHLAHARGYYGLGLAYELSGQPAQAEENYLRSSSSATMAGVHFLAINARCAAAQVQIAQGRLRQAQATAEAAVTLAEGDRLPPLGLAWCILGGIALERNELEHAEHLLLDGIALAKQGGLTEDAIVGLAHLARLHCARGDASAALAVTQELTALVQAVQTPRLAAWSAALRARIDLRTGDHRAAAAWATAYAAERASIATDYEDLTLARVLLANGDSQAVPALLQPQLQRAQAAGHMHIVIEAALLLALHHAPKDGRAAQSWLEQALRLAEPEGYVRLFMDEGAPMLALLSAARAVAPTYVDTLLAAFPPTPALQPSPFAALPEPLSEQEVRVLTLIVAGKSNQEIADELVITVGTAKWHVHNVLQKLGVSNRPQAIARARKLGVG
ncbi:MAG: helix-turn-helix transcriptional regulator [Chloroflexota bacterium]|nr:MAG: helix-turn-helix transcriptional regulator [Chloroflexota bacterium]